MKILLFFLLAVVFADEEGTIVTMYNPLPKPIINGVIPIGCFRDHRSRAIPNLDRIAHNRDPASWISILTECKKKAREKNVDIFGLQYYGQCFLPDENARFEEGDVVFYKYGPKYNCEGFMGSSWSNYVFQLCEEDTVSCNYFDGIPKPLPLTTTLEEYLTAAKVTKIGCYRDARKRVFPEKQNLDRKTDEKGMVETVQTCGELVRTVHGGKDEGYEFFAVEYWKECFYGPNLTLDDVTALGEMTNCQKGIVGGGWSFMIYRFD